MRKHFIGDTSTTVQLPENWNELSRWQLVMIAKHLNSNIPMNIAIKKVTFIILQLQKSLKRQFVYAFKLTPEQRKQEDIISSFVFEKEGLTTDTLKTIKVGKFWKTTLYGPGNMLGKTTFIEFIKADAYLKMYQKSKEEKFLNLFVACLYRQQFNEKHITESPNDIRSKFNEYEVESNAELLKTVPLAVKTVVVWYFIGCMEAIISKYPDLWPPLEEGETRTPSNNGGWIDTLMAMAGKKHGTIEQTAHTNLHTILYDISYTNRENELLNKKFK